MAVGAQDVEEGAEGGVLGKIRALAFGYIIIYVEQTIHRWKKTFGSLEGGVAETGERDHKGSGFRFQGEEFG